MQEAKENEFTHVLHVYKCEKEERKKNRWKIKKFLKGIRWWQYVRKFERVCIERTYSCIHIMVIISKICCHI